MGLFELHDNEAESRDDIVRMEIEAEAAEQPVEHDWWDWISHPWSDEFRSRQVTKWEDFEAYDD